MVKKMTKKALEQARREFCSQLVSMKHQAGVLGLFYTMKKMDIPLGMVGYEVAGTPELYKGD